MNLKNYDMEQKQLVLKQVYFNARMKKFNIWHVIICVDESGSMLDSVIHSAVMAGILPKCLCWIQSLLFLIQMSLI